MSAFLADRYLHPQPRLALAAALRDHASAAMDVSDGLAGDLAKMMRASGVSAESSSRKFRSRRPQRPVTADPALLDRLVTGGDDYEILCTVPPDGSRHAFAEEIGRDPVDGDRAGGRRTATRPAFRLCRDERRYDVGSFRHF